MAFLDIAVGMGTKPPIGHFSEKNMKWSESPPDVCGSYTQSRNWGGRFKGPDPPEIVLNLLKHYLKLL